MAVYVDDMQLPARAGRHDSAWSYLFADTREELHAFAERLGLRREWFQDDPHTWHYDVTAGKRQQAIRLGATLATWHQATQMTAATAEVIKALAEKDRVEARQRKPKRHSWERHGDYRKTCRDCGIAGPARPHPYERRWYQEYATPAGRCSTADRVPPCDSSAVPGLVPEAERSRHAEELDKAAGQAWRQGNFERAARLIADARALAPERAGVWARREAAIRRVAPPIPGCKPAVEAEAHGTARRSCESPHPRQDARLAARRSMEVPGTGRCQDGHPVTALSEVTAARLAAAGITAGDPALVYVRDWNRAAAARAAEQQKETAQ